MSPDRVYLPGGPGPCAGPPEHPEPSPGLAVLVVSYRRIDLLEQCLDAVAEHLPHASVHVWDNTGRDTPGLVELVAGRPRVDWTLSDVNVGFAAAVNQLVERAAPRDVLLLNPDALLVGPLSGCLAALAEGDVAAAAPSIEDDSEGATHVGTRPWDVAHRRSGVVRALVAHTGYAGRLRGSAVSDLYRETPYDVEGYLTGACLLISRAAWRDVGPFDEEFFLYGEETDWQLRARDAGWRLRYVDEPGVRHTGHGTVAGDGVASRRSGDLLEANVALVLEHSGGPRGVHKADAYLAGAAVIDRLQPSKRRARAARRPPATRPAVVITINRLVFGGAERHHAVLAAELHRRGYPVTVVAVQRFGPLIREIDPGVRVVRRPWWSPALDLPDGPAVLVGGDTNTEVGFSALWRRARRDRRWLAAAHMPPVPDGPTFGRALGVALQAADGFVALSPRHWEQLTAHQDLGLRHYVAPNGVVPPAAGTPVRVREPGRPLQLATLSRIVEDKNPHLLVEALDGLEDLDWELSIHGDGPDRARLEALTPAHLRDRVHWRGWSPGPDHALADCDLFCMPSRAEAFPLVVLEAMVRAIPVLASAVCAVPDMLDNGRAGRLVEPVDVPTWRAALRDVLTHPDDLPALGRRGQDRMLELYTVEKMVDAYEHAIDDVLSRPARPTRNVVRG